MFQIRKYLDCPWISPTPGLKCYQMNTPIRVGDIKGNTGCYEYFRSENTLAVLESPSMLYIGIRARRFQIQGVLCGPFCRLKFVGGAILLSYTLSTRVTSCIPAYFARKQNGAASREFQNRPGWSLFIRRQSWYFLTWINHKIRGYL